MKNAFCGTFSKSNRGVKNPTAEQCYGCNKYFTEKKKLEKHSEIFSSIPGVIKKFNNQNIKKFEDKFKFMGEVHFCVYFEFETTCGKNVYEFDKSAEFFSVFLWFCRDVSPQIKLRQNIC